MTASSAAKTLLFWVAVLWCGFMIWRGFGLQHPMALPGCVVAAYVFMKALLYFMVWMFERETEFGK